MTRASKDDRIPVVPHISKWIGCKIVEVETGKEKKLLNKLHKATNYTQFQVLKYKVKQVALDVTEKKRK